MEMIFSVLAVIGLLVFTIYIVKKPLSHDNLFPAGELYVPYKKEVNSIKEDLELTREERFNKIIELMSTNGYSVKFRTETQLQLVKPKEFSLLWAIVWLFVALVGILIYIFYYLSKNDEIITVTIPNDNIELDLDNNQISSDKLIKLAELLEKGLLTESEFLNEKQKILN